MKGKSIAERLRRAQRKIAERPPFSDWRAWWEPWPFYYQLQDPCVYCGHLRLGPFDGFDHLDPIAQGGKQQNNLAPACQSCNSRRGDMSPMHFLLWRMHDAHPFAYTRMRTVKVNRKGAFVPKTSYERMIPDLERMK